MPIDRRHLLGVTAFAGLAFAGAAAAAEPAPYALTIRAKGGATDYRAALEAIGAYAHAELVATGLPGMTLCVTDADGFTAVMTLGYADLERRLPVTPEHLFQIGSISKSFAALALFNLVDEGKVELDAPLARYIPGAALPSEPITVAQVLSHTAGLPADAPIFPRTPDGRLWTGFAPGSRFAYSNTGYDLLGLVIAAAAGEPHPAAIRRRVLAPLGLGGVAATIKSADRARYAVGYAPVQSDRPSLPGGRLAPGPWTEEDIAAGSIAATPEQMATYIRCLIAVGAGRGGPVMSDASAKRFSKPVIATDELGAGGFYASGLAVVPLDGISTFHHTGGMLAFSSSLRADWNAGVGAFASVNAWGGGYRPRLTTAYAVQAMRAARKGAPIPPPPAPPGSLAIRGGERFVGAYAAADGSRFEVKAVGDRLTIVDAAGEGRVQQAGKDRLITDHPRLGPHGLDFTFPPGGSATVWWGEMLYGRGSAPPQPASPERLKALAGRYLSHDPWVGDATVLARGEKLVAEGGEELKPAADGTWRFADPEAAAERLRFDGVVNGRAQRLNASGADMMRIV